MDNELWLQKAHKSIERVSSGHVFVLKDLFDGIEWSTLDKGDRLRFGGLFKNEVRNGKFPSVKYIGKASNNSAKYEKLEVCDSEATHL